MVTSSLAVRRAARGIAATLLATSVACGGGGGGEPVGPSTNVTISGISPSVLTPGATATITGTNFNATATSNTVTIDGIATTVVSASPTQLTVTVPSLPCTASHAAPVSVATPSSSASATQVVRGALGVNAPLGTAVLLTPTEARCAELGAGTGQLLLSVVNLAASPTSTTAFRLAGDAPSGAVASLGSATPAVLRQSVDAAGAPGLDLLRGGASAAERAHLNLLESNRAIFERLRGGRLDPTTAANRALRASTSGTHRSLIAPVPALGAQRQFRISKLSTAVGASGTCNDYDEITARVVYVGTKGIVYEDVAAPLAGKVDTLLQSIGREFDTAMYVVDSTYFGDPLVTDGDTDDDRHVNMVFTPKILPGVAGFVISCDFFLRDSVNNNVSNLGENFYAIVPTVDAAGFASGTPASWYRGMRHTIVHEVKHIASFGARVKNHSNNYDESWLEEGTARHAEELWERRFLYNKPWKSNIDYRSSVYCDVRPTFPECAGAPIGIFNHFATLYDVMVDPGASSVFGRVSDGDFKFYASAWSFVRYAIDRYATDEATFLRAITQATTTRGMASISAASGQNANDVFARWTLALYTDGIVTSSPDLDFPTWNTRDIFANMNKDFASQNFFTRPFPLVPAATSSAAFTLDNPGIHGGSFTQYLVPGNATAGRLVRLTSTGGTAEVPSTMRLAITRVP